MLKWIQRAFTGGQQDEVLTGRQDLDSYFRAGRLIRNWIIKRQGCISKRRGTELVADLTDLFGDGSSVTDSRLIPFMYERDGGYLLLFACSSAGGTAKVFVCSKQGVLSSFDTPFVEKELAALSYVQSGDTMYLAHHLHPPARILRASDGTFSYDVIDFRKMGETTEYYPPTISAAVQNAEGTGATKMVYYKATYVKNGVESASSSAVYISYKIPWSSGQQVKITLTKGSNAEEPDYYNIYKKDSSGWGWVGRTSDGFGEVELMLSSVSGVFGAPAVSGGAISGVDTTLSDTYKSRFLSGGYSAVPFAGYSYEVPQGGALSTNSSEGAYFAFGKGVLATYFDVELGVTGFVEEGGVQYLAVHRCSGDTLLAVGTFTNGTTTETFTKDYTITPQENVLSAISSSMSEAEVRALIASQLVSVDFTSEVEEAFPGGGVWCSGLRLLSTLGGGYVRIPITGIACSSRDAHPDTFYDDYITPDVSLTPPTREDHFDKEGDYPACVALAQQRLIYAATDNEPYSFWMSTIGDLLNFNEHETVREDDAISVTIPATEFPEINHVVTGRDIIFLCDNGEWIASPTSGNAITYETIKLELESRVGCSKRLMPQVIGDEYLFVEQTGEVVRLMRYNWTSDGYESKDVAVFSASIFRNNPIVGFAYKQHPDSLVVCVLEDGTLATLSYMREQEVCAWSTHALGGGLKAIGVATDKSLTDGTTNTYILAEKDGNYQLLRIREDGPTATVKQALCLDAMEFATADAETAIPDGKVAIDLLTGEEKTTLTAGKDYAFGYLFDAVFRSVTPEIADSSVAITHEIKNVQSIEMRSSTATPLQVIPTPLEDDTSGMNYWVQAYHAPEVVDGAVAYDKADTKVVIAGINDISGGVTIKSATAWPMVLLSYALNIKYGAQTNQVEG